MDDNRRRADNKAWDEKQDRWIWDANRKIEEGLSGEALAALHGLHVPPDNEPPYDVDEATEVDDQQTLNDKIITRLIQIGNTISLIEGSIVRSSRCPSHRFTIPIAQSG